MPSVATIIRRRRTRKARQRSERRRSSFWFFISLVLPALLVIVPVVTAVALAVWLYAQAAIYFPENLKIAAPATDAAVTRFFERSGKAPIYGLADPLGAERRWLDLAELPEHLVAATLQAEDPDFLQRARFDPLRALLQILGYMLGLPIADETGIAASMVDETLLPGARSSGLDEDLLRVALWAEAQRRHTSTELLEWYLNTKFYGKGAFGIQAAAQVYLGQSAHSLELSDAALLAAISLAPKPDTATFETEVRRLQADLLYEMFNLGTIDQDDFDRAAVAVSDLRSDLRQEPAIAPEFIAYARRQAEQILDSAGYNGSRLLASAGLYITTSLDLELYYQSECVMRAYWQRISGNTIEARALDGNDCGAARELRPIEIADDAALPDTGTALILDVQSGEILSLVGTANDYAHQPAVILQPVVYMEGFSRRLYTPASMVYDLPNVYPGPAEGLIYAPSNPDGRFRGPLNLRGAMAAGLLPPVVQVADDVGMSSVVRTAHRLGFNSLDEKQPGLALLEREGAVSVLDAGYAYSVLASSGLMRGFAREPIAPGYRGRDPVAILRIADADGRTLWEYDSEDSANQTAIFQPSLAYLVNDILADHEARQAVLESNSLPPRTTRGVAWIDGLSEDRRDSWTIGYNPEVVLAVRSGREDGAAMSLNPYERAASAPVWKALWSYLHQRNRVIPSEWSRPADVEEFLVCEISGMLPIASDHCPTRSEIVPAGSILLPDTRWQGVEINRVTGQLATALTPDNLRAEVVYFVPPDDILDWWIENNRPLPPSAYDSENRIEDVRAVRLTQPSDYAYVGGLVEVSGSVTEVGIVDYLLEYGEGVNPREWIDLASRSDFVAPLEFQTNWDTIGLHGVYTLRLTVDYRDGRRLADTKQVTLDNTAPVVDVRSSDGRTTFVYPAQEVISLLADASDNLTIERVEFYESGELLSVDRQWPFGLEHQIAGAGQLRFSARVFDQVGNSATSQLTVSVVES